MKPLYYMVLNIKKRKLLFIVTVTFSILSMRKVTTCNETNNGLY